jgi:hypothetical protein
MKNTLLFTLVGGLILFVWQFLSFAMLNLHGSASEHTPLQDEILERLAELELEEGMYALGTLSQEDYNDPAKVEAYLREQDGQPWAILNYHHAWQSDMTPNLIRSMLINFLLAFGFLWVMRKLAIEGTGERIAAAVGIGLIGFFFHPYSQFIWFEAPDIYAHLLDSIVPFVLLGWLSSKWS